MAEQLLEVLLSGVKAFIRESVHIARDAIRVVLAEVDQSSIGRAATGLIKVVSARYFNAAHDLVDEERELANKFKKDGRRSAVDIDRLSEIQAERADLRKKLDDVNTSNAVDELKSRANDVVSTELTDDEISSSTAILASKKCPECGGTMRIRQGKYDVKRDRRKFWWQCTAPNMLQCPTIKLDPTVKQAGVIRLPDPDLDGPVKKRREVWTRDDVLRQTHARIRQGLGEVDPAITCPHHLIPMKQLQRMDASGQMLDSYNFICVGVNEDGKACSYNVPIETFPQAAAMLRRREGKGIVDN